LHELSKKQPATYNDILVKTCVNPPQTLNAF